MNPIKFCPNCRNLLWPKEDKELKTLVNACRTCTYQEVEENKCVYTNYEHQPAIEEPQVLTNAYEDPTLPRAKGVQCPLCGHPKVAYFVAKPRESLARTFACCNPSCGHNWRNEE